MRSSTLATSVRIISVLVVLGIAVFPLYWMFVTSLTPDAELFSSTPQLLPDLSRLGIYGESWSGRVPQWLLNSFIIAAGTAIVTALLAIPFGYALSRFRFVGKAAILLGLFLTQMLPEALLVVPLFSLFSQFDLLNSLHGLVLADTAFTLPIVVFILKGAFDAIPRELEEAASVDGCSAFGTLVRISLPLIAPSIAATAVIAFFAGWNEYIFAVTFAFDAAIQPASVGLASFIGELSTPVQTVMSVAVMYTLPAVVFYLLAQKYIVSGMTAGGVKG